MIQSRKHSRTLFGIFSLLGLMLAGYSSTPSATSSPRADFEQLHAELGDGLSLDYQLERKISSVNGKSCYFFVSGSLLNQTNSALSRKSVLDFVAMNHGAQIYRDISHPVADIPPGKRTMFGLLASPTYMDGCPSYDKFNVSLRKVLLK